jgi:hypothetical protein
MLSDSLRFAVAMMVGDEQARCDALCAALEAMSLGADGEPIAAIAQRTGVHRKMIRRDLEEFVRRWRWTATELSPPIDPEVAQLSVPDQRQMTLEEA